MLRRLASLRLLLAATMILTAAAALTGAYFAISAIEHAEERAIVRQQASEAARAVAVHVLAGAGQARFRVDQAVLANDQLLIFRGGRRVFAGPAGGGDLSATATRSFPGGRVVVVGYANESNRVPIDLTLVLGLVIALVILAAAVTATLIARTVRGPIERTVAAADRVAAGDFSARIGTAGPAEFARLGRAFDGMATRLEAADRQQREFLADVAHEISTPVNAIAGFARALGDGTASDEPEREEAARTIANESERLEALVADLRRLTRLDAAEAVRVEPVDVGELCRELGRRFEAAARTAGLSLEVEAPPLPARSNKRLLEAVIVNLLTNAIRYTPTGGSIELRARRSREELAIAVKDTGIGIAPEHRARIFDRLYRVDEARDRVRGGSGLGLAIAQRAAQELGGRIELESEIGRGSLFRLVLPPRPASTASS
ncbi:MAG: HAMP domain-containing histidine kinase [Actinomycetota bacterium]|nr:HAMP domain-containing histidine kinase [Actinomycetota bacterium]